MTDELPSDEQRLRWRLLQADVAHLSERVDNYAAEFGLGPTSEADPAARMDGFPPTAATHGGAEDASRGLRNSAVAVRGAWQQLPAGLAADAWQALVAWVDALVDRYQLHEQVPHCWYRHGSMIEELHALHRAWCGAYYGTHAMPTDPAFWHDHLERVLSRIGRWDLRGCISGEHRDTALPTVDQRIVEERAQYIETDLQRRVALSHTGTAHDVS